MKKVWPIKDDAQRELFAFLLRRPEVAEALVDLTRGVRINTTGGGALAASVVTDLVGAWRGERKATKQRGETSDG